MSLRQSSPTIQVTNRRLILVVEDGDTLRQSVATAFADGYLILSAATFDEALRLVDNTSPVALVTDGHINGQNARLLLAELTTRSTPPPTIVVSRTAQAQHVAGEYKVGFVGKPIDQDKLAQEVVRAMRERLRPVTPG